MKPAIDGTKFGSITIDGAEFEHDVLIRLSGEIKKRKKKLSKAVYGTSHTISLDEAAEYFRQKGIRVELFPTPEAIRKWNKAKGRTIGLFHVTC